MGGRKPRPEDRQKFLRELAAREAARAAFARKLGLSEEEVRTALPHYWLNAPKLSEYITTHRRQQYRSRPFRRSMGNRKERAWFAESLERYRLALASLRMKSFRNRRRADAATKPRSDRRRAIIEDIADLDQLDWADEMEMDERE